MVQSKRSMMDSAIICSRYPVFAKLASHDSYRKMGLNEIATWDDALKKSTQEFQHINYNLFTCNCHSFVANNLNRMVYGGHNKWNVAKLGHLDVLQRYLGEQSSCCKVVVAFCGGVLPRASFIASVLVGWFIIGTYCFKTLVHL